MAQVALSQLLAVKAGTPNLQSIRGRYKQLVADFVLRWRDFMAVAVIELDDSSHAAPDRQEVDQRKTKAVEAAVLRLIRIPAGPIPSQAKLQRLLELGGNTPTPLVGMQGITQPTISVWALVLRPALSLLLVGLVVIGALMAISHVASTLPKTMSTPPIVVSPVPVPRGTSPAPATANVAALQAAEQKRQEAARVLAAQQAADALAKRTQTTWDQYYKPSPSCEHPPAWADEVECGNQYIRAKREFEKIWSSQLSAQPSP